jgi:hypothetical protein
MTDAELEASVRAHLRPTWAEVVRAKGEVHRLLADGEPQGIRTLQTCLFADEGIAPVPTQGERLQLATRDDIEVVVTRSHPLIARNRLALAATEAVLDLAAQGAVIEVARAPDHGTGHPLVSSDDIVVSYQLGGYGAGIYYSTWLPTLAPAYRLAPRLSGEPPGWLVDPDLFTADLEQLDLDDRTRRCIAESLAAYRQGLFLASASLLGAASEGAWHAAGQRLRTLDGQLAKALDNDSPATKVQARVAEVLRQHSALRATVEDLHAQAALLRQLRNYGVHPRAAEAGHLERYFTDSGTAVLLMQTHTYLSRLAAAVATRLGAHDTTSTAT